MANFLSEASEIQNDLATIRRQIHQEPEIGLDLPKTQAKIVAALEGLSLEISTGKSLSSVTAVLRAGKSDKTVLLRADMDALPVSELADLPYKSQIDSAMHACGHDLHVAMLIGAAKLLVKNKSELSGETLEEFRSFLRSLIMHGLVGTALGGVCTLVGEPQNLLIGERMGWDFIEFFLRMAPITIPVLFAGLITTVVLETTGIFGFGQKLPEVARTIIEHYTEEEDLKRTHKEKWGIKVQAVSAILLIIGLAMHIAPVGFIGLETISSVFIAPSKK